MTLIEHPIVQLDEDRMTLIEHPIVQLDEGKMSSNGFSSQPFHSAELKVNKSTPTIIPFF